MRQSKLYQDLYATEDGRIFQYGKEIKQNLANGYPRINFKLNGKWKSVSSHRVIASAYCDNFSPGLYVNHRNGVKHDNRIDNLEWVTPGQNNKHAVESGLFTPAKGEASGQSKLTERDVLLIRSRYASGASQSELSREFGITTSNVWTIVSRNGWKHI